MANSFERTKKEMKKEMDGAVFITDLGKTPADFLNGPDGKRPGEGREPSGTIRIDLTHGITGRTIPPRSIWKKGEWKVTTEGKDWNIWVVSGEGTPGNYETREYEVPNELAKSLKPKHPAEWSKSLKGTSSHSSGSYWGNKPSSSSSYSAGLPFGLRIRCPNCGHFFKTNDLGDHAKNDACPAVQQKPVMWVMPCECHDDILETAEIMPGFPIDVKKLAGETDDQAPDVSGADQVKAATDAAKKETSNVGD
jgi:hypothetical protein